MQQHLAISEALQQAQAAEVGRALLSAELMLEGEGRLSQQWVDVWQLPWRRWVGGWWRQPMGAMGAAVEPAAGSLCVPCCLACCAAPPHQA
jgi:hypothetical protein